jgi:hypothetical protein
LPELHFPPGDLLAFLSVRLSFDLILFGGFLTSSSSLLFLAHLMLTLAHFIFGQTWIPDGFSA